MRMSSDHATLRGARSLLQVTAMRTSAILLASTLAACGGGNMSTTGDDVTVDAPAVAQCILPMSEADGGSVTALAAERCNVPGSMGAMHWYRELATMPSGPMDIVQLELWPNLGGFTGGTVKTGTFTITGDDADPTKCGICLRAVGHHGGTDQMVFFATGGTVELDSFGDAPTAMTATVTNAVFEEVDANNALVSGGCGSTMVPHVAITGPTTNVGGTGGGTGGGGGGTGGCKSTVGDI